ncbi:faciogenital dysplasia protein [Anaeramoeba flamelloides]|uniref:Faciogenital dysplasia protein n=1 Tax=Anaeramoeba flamelloides TaxID=1746091 RepID=A0AAV7ZYE3_9EUKA|nr:faciogenital dysplasia protein [Anaeramoeba flamelloides]
MSKKRNKIHKKLNTIGDEVSEQKRSLRKTKRENDLFINPKRKRFNKKKTFQQFGKKKENEKEKEKENTKEKKKTKKKLPPLPPRPKNYIPINKKHKQFSIGIKSETEIVLIQSKLRTFLEQRNHNSLLNRSLISKELETTERNYLNFLKFLLSTSQEIESKKILNKEELNKIFGDLKPIYDFNKTLFTKIEECTNPNNNNTSTISECFSTLTPYMGIYIPYINTYDQRFLEIEQLKMKKKKFSKYLGTIPKKPNSKGLRLQAIMIMPIQRLPRYVLLLRELIKHSKREEKQSIEEAMKKIETMTSKINEKKRSFENMMALYQIDKKLIAKNNFKLIEPSRYFIEQLDVIFVTTHTNISCVLLLFNDVLLLCVIEKPIFFWKRREEFYQLHYVFNLNRIKKLTNLVNNNGKCSFSFFFKKKIFQFKFNKGKFDPEKTESFLGKLKSTIAKQKKIIKDLKRANKNKKKSKRKSKSKSKNKNKSKNRNQNKSTSTNNINFDLFKNAEFINDDDYNDADEDEETLNETKIEFNSKIKEELLKKKSSWSLVSNYDILNEKECDDLISQINEMDNFGQYNQTLQPVFSMISQVLNQTWLFTKK